VGYRELLFGVVFGVGACAIDVVMHARMSGRSLLEELIWPSPGMVFYRVLFLAFGVGIGLLLWQKSKREREARHLADLVRKLRHDIAAPATVIHTNVQLLLIQRASTASADTETLLRTIYEQSQRLQSVLRE
jgi:hypothetical protein